jgi:hypothetical protein
LQSRREAVISDFHAWVRFLRPAVR